MLLRQCEVAKCSQLTTAVNERLYKYRIIDPYSIIAICILNASRHLVLIVFVLF